MANKSAYQNFQTGWSQAVSYANSNNISKSAWYPVYQQDSSRLINYGYGMSQGERINAIRSAAGLKPTQLPSDNPSPTNVPENIYHNAQSLFSATNLVHGISNLWDSVVGAVAHPYSEVFKPALDLEHIFATGGTGAEGQAAKTDFADTVLGQHGHSPDSIWGAAVPGAYDAAELFTGKAGLRQLADNPLYTVMDAIPIGRIPMEILGRTATGAALADRIGITTDELRRMTPGQAGMRRLSVATKLPRPIKGAVTFKDEAGKKIKAVPRAVGGKLGGAATPRGEMVEVTGGHVVRSLLATIGAGGDASKIIRELGTLENTSENKIKEMAQPFNDSWNKLSVDEKKPLMTYLSRDYHTNDLSSDEDIIHGNSEFTKDFTVDQLNAIDQTIILSREYRNLMINSGVLVYQPLRMPNPDHVEGDDKPATIDTMGLYLADDTSRYSTVKAAKEARDSIAQQLADSSVEYRGLTQNVEVMTAIMYQNIQKFMLLKQNIYDAIKSTLPQLANDPRAEQLRGILPSAQKFERFNNAQAKTMGDFLGISPKQREVVNRGRDQIEPLKGKRDSWSPQELEAYNQADRQLRQTSDLTPGTQAFRTQVEKDAKQRLRVLGQLRTVTQHGTINVKTVGIMSDLFRPGGYTDQMWQAFQEERWQDFDALTKLIDDKLNLASFKSPDASEVWNTWRTQMKAIRQFAKQRDSARQRVMELWDGTSHLTGTRLKGKAGQSIKGLTIALEKANTNFLNESVAHPPAMWDNYEALEYNRQVMETEAGRQKANENIGILRKRGWKEENLTALQRNDNTMVELGEVEAVASEANDCLSGVDPETAAQVRSEVKQSIAHLRSMGYEPLYLPTVHVSDEEKDFARTSISADHVRRQQASFERNEKFNSGTIYDFQTGYNKAVAEYWRNYMENWFQEHVMPQFLIPRSDFIRMAHSYFDAEMKDTIMQDDRTMDVKAFDNMILHRWGFKSYDPTSIFAISHPSVVGKDMYISKEVAQALSKRWHGEDMGWKTFDKGTNLFRSAILHWSPRFTLHVVVGGAVMLGAASDPIKLVENLGNAWRFARTGELPEEVRNSLQTKPDDAYLTAQIQRGAVGGPLTMSGSAQTIIEHQMGKEAARFALSEGLDRRFGKQVHAIGNVLNYLPHKNMQLTRFSYNLYHAAAFFEGFAKAKKSKYFMQEYYDEESHSFKYQRREMTGDQLFHEAVEHAARAMGDVLAMTPIERNFLTRAFPFWSWTRHVLSYVARFPVDHPYRAMLFSQLSRIALADQNSNLPARTQLLFFLGGQDQYGNMTGIDMRYANPLRDTANYMSLSGWWSGLNPAITAIPNAFDPQSSFGANVLYPNISYNSIYGTNDATQSGKEQAFSVLENYIPQAQGIDEALNLSGQYAYLRGSNPSAFTTKVLSAFGADFFLPQHVNLRQIASTNEIDRYNTAKKAAANAWQNGDFSQLSGYSEVPDPRYGTNPMVNIPVSDLQSLWNREAAYLVQSGLTAQGATPANYFPQLTNPKV
jgi:hypothetical protein